MKKTNFVLKNTSNIPISVREHRSHDKPAIIIAPGFYQSKETKTFKKIEDDLAKDFSVISMDFRGHGKSGGWYTFSAHEASDLKVVVEWARKMYSKIGVLGFSYGGSIAVIEQSQYKNTDSIVCVGSPMASKDVEFQWWKWDSIKAGLGTIEPGAGVRFGNPFLPKVAAKDVIAEVGIPIFLIHGEKDPTVFPRHSQEMYKRAQEPKKLLVIPKGVHAQNLYKQFGEDFLSPIREWFKNTLS